jgi:hypothetical protein
MMCYFLFGGGVQNAHGPKWETWITRRSRRGHGPARHIPFSLPLNLSFADERAPPPARSRKSSARSTSKRTARHTMLCRSSMTVKLPCWTWVLNENSRLDERTPSRRPQLPVRSSPPLLCSLTDRDVVTDIPDSSPEPPNGTYGWTD